ncbi:hypothetical protein [Polaromonas sp.]|uniref:hypothetical protein n=1 Tax=Polaromonas sp. TaxID=1869339 RepID=UPI00286D251D|nr:hypothetical protein [Polaromonas sp.]
MMDWLSTLKSLAPTVASALLGPLGGVAVSAIGGLLGVSDATQTKIADAIAAGQMTPEQISQLKALELQYQANEKERGFKYAELAFKDRDSARQANVQGGTQQHLFWLSLALLAATLGCEILVLFKGYPASTSEIIVGRVLGLMDSVALMVLAYWYGSSSGSSHKSELLARSEPVRP